MTVALGGRAVSLGDRMSGGVIGGVRILAGLLWLANVHWKVPTDFGEDTDSGLYKYSASVSRHSPFAPFTWMTEEIILPNFQLFGWVLLVSELLIAALLVVGWRTRIVALVAAALTVPVFLSVIYYDRADEWSWAYFMMIGLHLLLAATDAGRHFGLDGVLARGAVEARRALVVVGAVATILGIAGLVVARNVDFGGDEVALLGSDAGFVGEDGEIVRRWELKFLWFNPLWALLTIVGGLLLMYGGRRVWAAWAAGAWFAALAIAVFVVQTFDYARDDGAIQVVSTASNAAVWVAAALTAVLLAPRVAPRGAGDPTE
jgi:thiosulfate dehydrogenase [quinone] large subunit